MDRRKVSSLGNFAQAKASRRQRRTEACEPSEVIKITEKRYALDDEAHEKAQKYSAIPSMPGSTLRWLVAR